MKRIILTTIYTIFILRASEGVYQYQWWTSAKACEEVRYTDAFFPCLYEDLGYWENLKYIIAGPKYNFRKWSWEY